MKRTLACLAILAVSGWTVQGATGEPSLGFSTGVCRQDAEIAPDKRQAVDAEAQAFVQAVLDSQPDVAAQMMVAEARNNAATAQNMSSLSQYLRATGPYEDPKVEHTYLLETAGSGPDVTSICGSIAGTDWVAVETLAGATQAYAVISAKTVNNDWAFVLWLVHEGDAWRVRNIDVAMSSIVGHTADGLLKLAREQRDRGNAFNAQMLYAATELTSRGKTFQRSTLQAVQEDLPKLKKAPELEGNPPYSWKMGGATFKISQVNLLGVAGEIGLTFDLPVEHWKDDKDADQRNRAFLDAFRAAHPEFSQAFGFLVARAMKPDDSGGFSTVYDAKRGYL